MTPDLHPEELLDKAALGTLSDAERVWLDQHLAQCSVCRFEQAARADFAAVTADAGDIDGLVTRALSGLPAQPARAASGGRSRRRTVAMLAAATLMFSTFASFAAVSGWSGVWPKLLEAVHLTEPAPVTPPTAPRLVRPRHDSPAVIEPVVNEEVAAPEPQLAPEPRFAPAPAIVAAPAPVVRRVTSREPVSQTPPIPEIVAAPMLPDAGSLFGEANEARVRGDRANAVRLYRDLLHRYPTAPEARLSQATLGRLLLDSGDPAAALGELDSYLSSNELTLREEVLTARAIALSRLGRTVEEAAAWNALIEGYPDSIHAARARARLQELKGR